MPYQSPYILMSSNPIARIDPYGDADYYTEDGKIVASVDPSDESSYILNNDDDIEKAKNGDFSTLSNHVEKIPSKEVREAIKAAEERSNKPTKTGGKYDPNIADLEGGFHEEAVSWGIDANTGEELIINAKPGDYVNLLTDTEATIVTLSPGSDEDMRKLERIGSLGNIIGKAHIHSAGTKYGKHTVFLETKLWEAIQEPSNHDVKIVSDNTQIQHIVISANTNKVYFYGTKSQNKPNKTYRTEFPKDLFYNIK